MGYFDGSRMKLWQWAKEYTLADNFFMGAFGGSYLNHQWLICACTPRLQGRAAGACARGSMPTASSRRSRTRRRPAMARCRPIPAGLAAKSRRTASPSTPRSRRISRAAFRRPPAAALELADPKGTERLGLPLPPQTDQDDRRHAVGQGHQLGLVRRRLERRAGGRPPAAGREARDHLYARERRAQFPAAPSAVQLFRAVCAGHRRPRSSISRTATISCATSTRAACRRWRSTSRSGASTSIRPTPTC